METDIRVTGFTIHDYGDESVGIFSASWMLNGEFFFTDNNELKEFKKKLAEAFEWATNGPVEIMTLEELKQHIIDDTKKWGEI